MKIPVLIPNIFNHPFTYKTDNKLNIGEYVVVPFGKSKMTGVVWDHFEKTKKKNFFTKKILKKLKIKPLNISTIKFLNWFSEYNLIPKGMSLKLHMLSSEAIEKLNDKEYEIYNVLLKKKFFHLNDEQQKVFNELHTNIERFKVHLLQGTTGSGKTIVYFNLVKKKIELGYQGLILLPEIGLTSEFEEKFKQYFGFAPAIWHSAVSKKKETYLEWIIFWKN